MVDKKRKNPWSFISSKNIYENPWIYIQEDQIINPAGKPGIYGKVCFKSQATGIIPVDDEGNTWLVGQHRYTLNQWSWEIPMGGSPTGEDCKTTALRELEEETGLIAGSLEQILFLHTSNSITDEEAYVFLARDLRPGVAALEDTESDLEVKKLSLSDAIGMAQNGQITDAVSVAGLLHLALNAENYGIQLKQDDV
ncbi:MAG: NUDIX hydrolase [Gammaproteobacteria bacterium]|nr:NUDIX hydrolase [Gammaproteobacteria bacterium]